MFEELVDHVFAIALTFWQVWVLSAPWLALGFVMAAVMKAFIDSDLLSKYLGGDSLWDVTKAAVIGAPLPLCSCGVVPAALSLRASGASKNTTISFLIATPETGVDSVPLTYGLMGPVMAVVRPIAAIISAIVSGLLVGSDQADDRQKEASISSCESLSGVENDCCVSAQKESVACCDSEPQPNPNPSYLEKIQSGLTFAFGQLLDDVAVWLLIGLLVAALVQVYLPADFFAGLGDGLWPMVMMAVIGVPMYVCATASTPMAAGFLALGLSPGAVLVFMLLGPASNIGTLMIIKNVLGVRAIVGYLCGSVIVAFAFGMTLNAVSAYMDWNWSGVQALINHEHTNIWEQLIAVIMALFVVRTLWLKIQIKLTTKPVECCDGH